MGKRVYTDPSTGEWVGEHEVRVDGEVQRSTEWFDTEEQAEHFAKTGKRPAIYLSQAETSRLLEETQTPGRALAVPWGGTDPRGLLLFDIEVNIWARDLVRRWRREAQQ